MPVPRPQDRGAGSQWPLNGGNTFIPRPFGKSTGPHFQAPAGPVSVQQPPHCGEGISLFDQGPCPPAPFWPHPKTGHGHMGSRHQRGHMGFQHQAKSEDQLFAKLLIRASKPAASRWKGGLPANLVGQQKEVPTLHCGAREGLLTVSKPMSRHKLHCDPQNTHTHPDLWSLSVCPFTNPLAGMFNLNLEHESEI